MTQKSVQIILSVFILLLIFTFVSCDKEPYIAYNYNIHIPDTNFKKALLDQYIIDIESPLDHNGDGEISDGEAVMIRNLYLMDYKIKDLEGIAAFVNVTYLDVSFNEIITLDVSFNTKLWDLLCGRNEIENLNVSGCSNLNTLFCGYNKLKDLDLSQNKKLRSFNCMNNEFEHIDLSKNVELDLLVITDNQFSEIDLTHNLELKSFRFYNNSFQEIDLSYLQNLSGITIGGNQFVRIDISNNPNIDFIRLEFEEPFLEEICVWDMAYPTEKLHLVGFEDYSIFKFCDK